MNAFGIPNRVMIGAWLVFFASAVFLQRINSLFALDTDDAYITYRYARNIAEGRGFVYNPGERVLGTTTPLYTLLLAGAGAANINIPAASGFFNVLFGALSAVLAFLMAQRVAGGLLFGFGAAALMLSFHEFALYSVSGMETSAYMFFVLGAFYAYGAQRLRLAALLAALALLTRLDGAAVAAAICADYMLRRRRLPPWKAALVFAACLAPWFLFSQWYFGSPLPNSMLAKHQHVLAENRLWMLRFAFDYRMLALWAPIALGLPIAFARRKANPGATALLLWAIFYIAAYTAYRIDLYRWYYTPLVAGMAVLAACGMGWAWGAARDLRAAAASSANGAGESAGSSLWHLALGLPMALGAAVYLLQQAAVASPIIKENIIWTNSLEQARADCARAILERSYSGDVICTGAIGIVGWATRLPIYDRMGLVTKDAVNRDLPSQLAVSNARWCVLETEGTTSTTARIAEGYEHVGTFNRGMKISFLLYEKTGRNESPAPDPALLADTRDLELANGLAIRNARLSNRTIRFDLIALRPCPRDYKIFVHIYRKDAPNGDILKIRDFYPMPATSKLTVGTPSPNMIMLGDDLPSEGAIVRLGLFDELDPQYAPLACADGRIDIRLIHDGSK